uniref:Uncharacterized protein n=1 Tax=Oryza punctata TaxID=4537 RepID=A0A0E0JY03_ORYPU
MAHPLEDDDLLADILLRPPSRAPPSSPPTATSSAASAPATLSFVPTMHGSPDRIPSTARFSLRFDGGDDDDFWCRILGCRDGLVLVVNPSPRRRCFLVWDPVSGDQRPVPFPPEIVLIGHSLHWLQLGIPGGILELDLNEQRMAALGFVFMSDLGAQFWKRKNCWDDVSGSGWVLEKTIQLGKLLSLSPTERNGLPIIMGFSEEYNVIFLKTINGPFMVPLESMEFKRILEDCGALFIYPFASVYTAGILPGLMQYDTLIKVHLSVGI